MIQNERRVRRGLFEPDTTPPLGSVRDEMVMAHPGRVGARLEKPGLGDTPYRSRLYVTGRQSADGNDYRPGDPIPEAEAVRQGITEGSPIALPYQPPDTKLCPRCYGVGRYSIKGKPKNHPAEHPGCLFCGPCPVCDGMGYVAREGASDDGG